MTIRIGTRRSPLAQAQASWVADRLRADGTDVELVGIVTTGDTDRRQLTQIGGTGVFAAAVRDAVALGEVDLAVHSLKDLPTQADPRLEVTAVPGREDVRDVLVGTRLADLADGMTVGTGSPRRAVQLQAWARSHGRKLLIRPIRGNVDTRLKQLSLGLDAVVLAAAGLRRLGRLTTLSDPVSVPSHDVPPGSTQNWAVGDLPADPLPLSVMLPAAGQGALALETARHDSMSSDARHHDVIRRVRALDDASAHAAVTAERTFLAAIEAGCLAPVGVVAQADGTRLTLTAALGDPATSGDEQDPSLIQLSEVGTAHTAAALGRRAAGVALGRMTELGWSTQRPAESE